MFRRMNITNERFKKIVDRKEKIIELIQQKPPCWYGYIQKYGRPSITKKKLKKPERMKDLNDMSYWNPEGYV